MNTVGYIADGKILCLENGANIQYLCTYNGSSFLSLTTGQSLHSDFQNGIAIHKTHSLSHFEGKIKITDFAHDGCFVRHSETTRPLAFRLILPPYCHAYRYPDLHLGGSSLPCLLTVIPQGVPKPEGGATQKEQKLLITLLGDGSFSSDNTEISLSPGRCSILFCLGRQGNELSTVKRCLHETEAPTLEQCALYRRALKRHETDFPLSLAGKEVFDTLCALTSQNDGILAGHGNFACLLFDQVLAANAFLKMKETQKAIATAEFLLSHFEIFRHLPLSLSADSLGALNESTDREYVLYPSVANFFLDLAEQCTDPAAQKRYEGAARRIYGMIKTQVGKEGFDFSTSEFFMRQNALPPGRILYGNAPANCEYLYLCKRLHTEDGKCIEETISRFLTQELPCIDDPNRIGKLHLPDTVYGNCFGCPEHARYVGWLKRGKYGSYLCPSCYAKGMRECLSFDDGKPVILPGSYALCCKLLWKADIIDRKQFVIALSKCVRFADESADTVSFFELSLLTSVLSEVSDASLHTLRNRLDSMLSHRTFPLFAAECAAYLLAQTE